MNFLKKMGASASATMKSAKVGIQHQTLRAKGYAHSKKKTDYKIDDPLLGPLVDNLMQTEVSLKGLEKAIKSFSTSMTKICKSSASFSEVVMVIVEKSPESGKDALAYHAAVNALAPPETPHSAVSVLQKELDQIAILADTTKIAAIKLNVQERESRRIDIEEWQKEVDFMKTQPEKYAHEKIIELESKIKLETGLYDEHHKKLVSELTQFDEKRFDNVNEGYQKLKSCQQKFFMYAAKAVNGELSGLPAPIAPDASKEPKESAVGAVTA